MSYSKFDSFVAWCRFRAAAPHIRSNTRVCDLGCGEGAPFLKYITARLNFGVGLDEHVEQSTDKKIVILRANITSALPLLSDQFDHVTMLAVLEHLQHPGSTLSEAFRILRPNGSLIMTWPSALVDPILTFCTKLGIVNADMGFEQHQPRIPRAALEDMLRRIGFAHVRMGSFELGLNNWLVAQKQTAPPTD